MMIFICTPTNIYMMMGCSIISSITQSSKLMNEERKYFYTCTILHKTVHTLWYKSNSIRTTCCSTVLTDFDTILLGFSLCYYSIITVGNSHDNSPVSTQCAEIED